MRTGKRIAAVLLGAALLAGSVLPTAADYVTNGTRGLVSGGEVITTTDARMALQRAAGKLTLSDEAFAAADVDGDGRITTTDARLILQRAADKFRFFESATAGASVSWTVKGPEFTTGVNMDRSVPKSGPYWETLHGAGYLQYGLLSFGDGSPSILQLELGVEADCAGKPLEVRLDSPTGELLDTVNLNAGYGVENLYLNDVSGTHSLVLVLPQEGTLNVQRLTYCTDWTMNKDASRLDVWRSTGYGAELTLPSDFAGADNAAAIVEGAKAVGAGYLMAPAPMSLSYYTANFGQNFEALNEACQAAQLPFGACVTLQQPEMFPPLESVELSPEACRANIREVLAALILDQHVAILRLDAPDETLYSDADLSALYNYCRTLNPALVVSCARTGSDKFGDYTPLEGQSASGLSAFESRYDASALTFPQLLRTMCAVRADGGNLLLNVTLNADGSFAPTSPLLNAGGWLQRYGAALKAEAISFPYTFSNDVFFTRADGYLNVFVENWPESGTLVLPPITVPVTGASLLDDTQALPFTQTATGVAVTLPAKPAIDVPVVTLRTEGTPAPAATALRTESLLTDATLTSSTNAAALGNLTDASTGTVWSTGADAAWVEVDFGKPLVVNLLRALETGAAAGDWVVECPDGDGWRTLASGTGLNNDRLLSFDATLTQKLRLRFPAGGNVRLNTLEIFAGERTNMYTTISDWNGYKQINFTVGGRDSYIVCPKVAAEGNPWVWRAEFFGAFDSVDRELLERGWHLVYHSMSELYGNDTAMGYMDEFQTVAEDEFGLNPRTVIFGFSRGGCYAINYAHFHPERVGALYLDAPYSDFNAANLEIYADMMKNVLNSYGLKSVEELKNFHPMPNDYAASIGKAGIPVLLCVGLADIDVNYDMAGKVFGSAYKAAGGNLLLFEKPDCGHHPHSFSDAEHVKQMADFLEQNRLTK